MDFKPFNQKTVQNLLINLKPGDTKNVFELQDCLRALSSEHAQDSLLASTDPLAELPMFAKPGSIA